MSADVAAESRIEFSIARKYFTNLNAFRNHDKYTDVTIFCGDERFRCHRVALAVASHYFDVMFGDNFKENTDKKVVLHDIDPVDFNLVLQFFYTGKLVIDANNVYNLLHISDFLGVECLEELCIRFVSQNLHNLNALELFVFACMTEKKALIDMLNRRDMTKQLEQLFQSDAHLGISFDVFARIVKQWKSTSQDPIVRWVNYSGEKRRQHFDDLVRIHAESIILDKSMYIYLDYVNRDKALVLNQSQSVYCSVLRTTKEFKDGITNQPAVFDDGRIFYLRAKHSFDFVVSTSSGDVGQTSNLCSPPYLPCDPIISGMMNSGIYLYDRCLDWREHRYLWLEVSTHNDYRREIHYYNCELDSWFEISPMKTRLKYACMAVVDNMLYMIGGKNKYGYVNGYVQAYDHRAGVWLEMPKTSFRYSGGQCCKLNDSIYVCGGAKNRKRAERFDLVAGKWEKIRSTHFEVNYSVPLVAYADQIWAVQTHSQDYLHTNIYDTRSKTWSISTLLRETADDNFPAEHFRKVTMAFVSRLL